MAFPTPIPGTGPVQNQVNEMFARVQGAPFSPYSSTRPPINQQLLSDISQQMGGRSGQSALNSMVTNAALEAGIPGNMIDNGRVPNGTRLNMPAVPTSVQTATNAVDDVIIDSIKPGAKVLAKEGGEEVIKKGLRARLLGGAGGGAKGLLKTGLGKGLGLGAGGLIVGGMIEGMDVGGEGSEWDQVLGDTVKGAGIGAGIGMVGGPWGAAIGGAAGGIVGGLYGHFTGDSSNKESRINDAYTGMSTTISELASTYGLSDATLANVMLEFDAAAQININQGDEDGMKALIDTLELTLPGKLMEYRLQEEQERKQNERVMGLQAEFAPMFQSIMNRSGINSDVAYMQAIKSADSLATTNPQMADLIRSNAASTNSNNDALMAAYATQIATMPSTPLQAQENALLQQTMFG